MAKSTKDRRHGSDHSELRKDDLLDPDAAVDSQDISSASSMKSPRPERHGIQDLQEILDQLHGSVDVEKKGRVNQSLKAANKEIMASNEELQSINEELETAKEELESSNEELPTINQELESRNDELFLTNSDLQNLVVSLEVPILFVGPDLRVRRISPAAEKLMGIGPEDVGRVITSLNLKIALPDFPEILFRHDVAERDVRSQDGSWYSLRIRPHRTPDGGIDGSVMLLSDITERKAAEEALHQGEERFRTVADFTYDWEYWIDPHGSFLYVSPSCERITGYPAESFLRDPRLLQALIHPDDRQRFMSHVQNEDLEEGSFNQEFRILTRSGEERWIGHVCIPVFGADGTYLGRRASNRDITARKTAEAGLRKAEEKYRSIFENAVEGIFQTTPGGTILNANHALARILGFDSAEALLESGRPAASFYCRAEDRQRFLEQMHKVGIVEDMEVQLRRPDGTHVWASLSGRTVTIPTVPKDLPQCFEGSLLDISGRKKAEEERAHLEEQVRHSQKMEAVGTLAGGIAHDFNNLLQAISGSIQLLLMRKPPDDPEAKQLRDVDRAAAQAAELVSHLLTFSRKTKVSFQEVRLNSIIEESVRLLERTIPKMVSISLDLGEDLPSLFADSTQIEQVLLNLVSNSRDAMPQGGGVTISTREVLLGDEFAGKHLDFLPGRYVLLTVTDTGHGMDHETLLHMFEPFFTTKEKDKGTGLGMAMVYGIIKGHGGHIHCESRVGGGTIFRIYLPVEKRPDAQRVVDVPSPSGLKGGETILIVDDQEIVLQILEDMLLQYGYSVIQCRSGEEALETYSKRAKEIDLVIMDLGMPGMGGEAAISAFKAMHRPPKILVASGYSNHRISVSPGKFGAADFISKPYRFKELLAKVRTILDREKKMKSGAA